MEVSKWSNASGSNTFNVLEKVEPIVRTDDRHVLCLDYLASGFASDQIIVKKTGDGANAKGVQLLSAISSNSIDQTAVIIRRLIRTVFTAMSGFRSFRVAGDAGVQPKEKLANFEFDPFDQKRSAYYNNELKDYGFCLVLEEFTYSGPLRDAPAYCNNPTGYLAERSSKFARAYANYDALPITPQAAGIVYRPRVEYQLFIFMKDDPQRKDDLGGRAVPRDKGYLRGRDEPRGPDSWQLRKSMPVLMENISPVLSIVVDRAVFTTKKTLLTFNKGALLNVCISKGSEAVEVAKIPLEVVKSIVKLPTEIVQIQYDQITQSALLVKAENDLLVAQKNYLALLNSSEAESKVTTDQISRPKKFEIAVEDDRAGKLAPGALDAAVCDNKFASAQ